MSKLHPHIIRYILGALTTCCVHIGAWAQSGAKEESIMQIVEWNVENLFDTHDDENHADEEFLPEGSHHWTRTRYWQKLDEIAKTIVGIGDTLGLPSLVGMCEVENDTVMMDLTTRSILRTAGYHYIMTDSPDRRGIDAALLYHPASFRLLSHHSIRVPSQENKLNPTRDILYACGKTITEDTLHVIVCHLPSKAGGIINSGKHRKLATQTIRSVIDSLYTTPNPKIIVMGDFNATPRESIFKHLCPPLRETLPTSRRQLSKPIGTYYFHKQWSYLDHILISPNIQIQGYAHEARLPHLLERDGSPRRTFKGPSYNGGISDHLPLLLKVVMEGEEL